MQIFYSHLKNKTKRNKLKSSIFLKRCCTFYINWRKLFLDLMWYKLIIFLVTIFTFHNITHDLMANEFECISDLQDVKILKAYIYSSPPQVSMWRGFAGKNSWPVALPFTYFPAGRRKPHLLGRFGRRNPAWSFISPFSSWEAAACRKQIITAFPCPEFYTARCPDRTSEAFDQCPWLCR